MATETPVVVFSADQIPKEKVERPLDLSNIYLRIIQSCLLFILFILMLLEFLQLKSIRTNDPLVKQIAAFISENVFHGQLKADLSSIRLEFILECVALLSGIVCNIIGYLRRWWVIDLLTGILILTAFSYNLSYWAVQNCTSVVNSKTIVPEDSVIADIILLIPGIGSRIVILYANVCQLKKGIISTQAILFFVVVVCMVNSCRYGRKLVL